MRELRDQELRVRLMTVADAAAVHACRSHPEVARFSGWVPADVATVRELARDQRGAQPGATPGIAQLAIVEHDQVVGDFGLITRNPGAQVELGIVLHPGAQGRGLATRACRLLLDHLFAQGVHRVSARVDPRNTASLSLFDRLGFRREGRELECYWDDRSATWTDEIVFALLAREWPR